MVVWQSVRDSLSLTDYPRLGPRGGGEGSSLGRASTIRGAGGCSCPALGRTFIGDCICVALGREGQDMS